MPGSSSSAGAAWLTFALLTVLCWGLYGVFLHAGQVAMADSVNGRYKAFFWVGIAYLIIAVLGPILMMVKGGSSWNFPVKGITWSTLAGIVGALGAFFVLLAFGARGAPSVVMSIIFAGAPIVNAIVVISLHPPAGGFSAIPWPFYIGILMAAAGGCIVTLFKP